jgi:hypothetical protein
MPALRRRATLWMRFQVEYLAANDGQWHVIPKDGESKWRPLGRTRDQVVESGRDFTFLPPTDGGAHHLRGVVVFKWTRHGRTVLRYKRLTDAGHKSTAGADPAGYSAGVCDIT